MYVTVVCICTYTTIYLVTYNLWHVLPNFVMQMQNDRTLEKKSCLHTPAFHMTTHISSICDCLHARIYNGRQWELESKSWKTFTLHWIFLRTNWISFLHMIFNIFENSHAKRSHFAYGCVISPLPVKHMNETSTRIANGNVTHRFRWIEKKWESVWQNSRFMNMMNGERSCITITGIVLYNHFNKKNLYGTELLKHLVSCCIGLTVAKHYTVLYTTIASTIKERSAYVNVCCTIRMFSVFPTIIFTSSNFVIVVIESHL